MQVAQAWALISISEGRQYAGNLGYQDDPKQIYRYDSLVPNHLQVSVGDLVFVRDRESVLGMARIDQIIVAQGAKTRLKCPTCGTHRILERHRRLPRWRCVKGHLFDKPTQEEVKVNTYEARYGRSFVSVGNVLSVADLKRAAPHPSDQLSIEKIDLTSLADRLVSAIPSARDFFARYLQATRPVPVNSEYVWRSGAAEVDESYKPSFVDTRERIKRAIALRRGQRTFRDKLIRRYGPACMISGCPLLDIVEAAHIWPYRNQADNHPGNGLPRGKRCVDEVPHGRWNITTFLAALRLDRIDAPWLLEGPIDDESFRIYVPSVLVPTLRQSDIVIMDNLGSHMGKAVRELIRSTGLRWPIGPIGAEGTGANGPTTGQRAFRERLGAAARTLIEAKGLLAGLAGIALKEHL
jgi:putative restriction endonuclease